jgi:hypothetical protein
MCIIVFLADPSGRGINVETHQIAQLPVVLLAAHHDQHVAHQIGTSTHPHIKIHYTSTNEIHKRGSLALENVSLSESGNFNFDCLYLYQVYHLSASDFLSVVNIAFECESTIAKEKFKF